MILLALALFGIAGQAWATLHYGFGTGKALVVALPFAMLNIGLGIYVCNHLGWL